MKSLLILSALALTGIQAQGDPKAATPPSGPPSGGAPKAATPPPSAGGAPKATGPPSGGGAPKGAPGAKGGAGAPKGGNSGIMSALGGLFGENGVPMGPAPKGCAAYEVIVGPSHVFPIFVLFFIACPSF
jgi:hypothetical protein